MDKGEERRSNFRVAFRVAVSVIEKGGSGRTISADCEGTRDISLKGLYIMTPEPLSPGTECLIELRPAGDSGDPRLHIQGKVVRTDHKGMAVAFSGMELDALIYLKNILYYNSGDPERIDAELSGDKGLG